LFKKGWLIFSEILDLSSPNTREKYLLKTKCLAFFSLQATAVDRCESYIQSTIKSKNDSSTFLFLGRLGSQGSPENYNAVIK
jgi:hypothetical protein